MTIEFPQEFGGNACFDLLCSLLPAAGAALVEAGGAVICAAGLWDDKAAAAAAALATRGAADGRRSVRLDDRRGLCLTPLALSQASQASPAPGDAPAFLAVVGEDREGLAGATAAMATAMAECQRLNAELDGIATELADRYEELNLVYATSRGKAGDSVDTRAALEQLVENCREHLGASLVALLLPEQRLVFQTHDQRCPVSCLDAFLRAVSADFLPGFRKDKRPVVCNEGLNGQAAILKPHGEMKLAATPVIDGHESVCGLLLMINPVSAADFSNSDKNLLHSLAEKAARIRQSGYDELTGLASRSVFEAQLEKARGWCREERILCSVLCVGLDQLKVINETLGHDAGTALVHLAGRHLDTYQGEGRLAACLGNDQFGLLLENCPVDQARDIADAVRLSLAALDFTHAGESVTLSASIGVAEMSGESASVQAVLKGAELACASAAERGRDRVHVYQDGAASLVERTELMRWVGRIHNALRKDLFTLYGQLISPLDGCSEAHVEVLLRMIDDDGVVQSPSTFMPAAERFFLMPTLDRWVVRGALERLAASEFGGLTCSINLSGQSLSDETFVEFLESELDRHAVDPGRVIFEITETAALTSLESASQFILRIKERGCRFSLDDFGTGVSSFSYLKALPVDFVKIDGSFVRDMIEDPVSRSMVAAINSVGHAMGLKIVAEYVENQAIAERLRELGVDYAQGYGIEKPVPLSQHLPPCRAASEAAL